MIIKDNIYFRKKCKIFHFFQDNFYINILKSNGIYSMYHIDNEFINTIFC